MQSIYNFLCETLLIPIYQDFIPKTAYQPSACYSITERAVERELKGTPIFRSVKVQVDIASSVSRMECSQVCDRLRALDGCFSHPNFKYIEILTDSDDPISDTSAMIYATNIELRLSPKTIK